MSIYADTHRENPNTPIRVHPLLLSLSETINASETSPQIAAISENDERALTSNLYTSPSALPPLEMHFATKNGQSLLSTRNGYALTSVAGCRECMASAPQADSRGEGNATQCDSAATFHALEDNTAHIGSASLSMHNKGKKRRRASSSGVRGNLPNTHRPKAAASTRRTRGKSAQKARSRDVNTSPPEETSEGGDRGVEPCMFTRSLVPCVADDICCSLNVQMVI